MAKSKFSKEERDILKDFEDDLLESSLTKKRKNVFKQAAETIFKKDKRINIRLSNRDLEALQRRALEEDVPYQTLVSSVLHKYVSGSLQDIRPIKASKLSGS